MFGNDRDIFVNFNEKKLKGFFVNFFLMHRVGYRQDGKKSDLWEKKSKIPHNFFVTKATDLKTTFLGSP